MTSLQDRNLLTSRISIIFLVLCLPYYLIFDYLGLYHARAFVLPTAVPAIISLLLYRYGWHAASKLILILGTGLCLLMASNILGAGAGMETLILSLLPLPFLLFGFSEKRFVFICVVGIFVTYVGIVQGFAAHMVTPEIMSDETFGLITYLVGITTFLLLGLSSGAYFISRHHDLEQIVEKTQALETSNDQLQVSNNTLQTAYEDLQAQQNLLEKAWHDSVYAQLTRTIAHELKNPLFEFGMIIGALEKSLDDRETAMMFITSLATTIEELMALVNAMLESGGASVGEYQALQIADVMRRVLILAEGSIHKRNIRLTKEISDLPLIMGDSKSFLMVFSNLIVNAMEAMGDEKGAGGELYVRVMRDLAPAEGRQGVVIEIADTGVGIPKSRQASLFKGGHSTKGMEDRQRGMGLSLVWKLIDQMGGEISVHSDPDSQPGTMFRIVV